MTALSQTISSRLGQEFSELDCTLMEVCGTHTNVIRRAGIHNLLPRGIRLLSGPGCPVCVTGSGYLEQAICFEPEARGDHYYLRRPAQSTRK